MSFRKSFVEGEWRWFQRYYRSTQCILFLPPLLLCQRLDPFRFLKICSDMLIQSPPRKPAELSHMEPVTQLSASKHSIMQPIVINVVNNYHYNHVSLAGRGVVVPPPPKRTIRASRQHYQRFFIHLSKTPFLERA